MVADTGNGSQDLLQVYQIPVHFQARCTWTTVAQHAVPQPNGLCYDVQ